MAQTVSPEDIKRYQRHIEFARRYQERSWEKKANRRLDYYKGDHPLRIEKPLDAVIVNYIGSVINIKVAALAATPPQWRFTANRPEFEVNARVWEAVMPWVWREAEIHPQTRAALKDAKIFGLGVVKIGYRLTTTDELFVDVEPEKIDEARAQFKMEQLGLVELPGGRVVMRNPDAQIVYDNVFVERVNPYDIYWDPEVDFLNLPRAEWIIQKFVWALDDVKANKDFKDTKKLKGDQTYRQDLLKRRPEDLSLRERDEKDDIARVTLWEIHDRRKQRIVTFADEQKDKPLHSKPMNHPFDGYQFEFIGDFDVPNEAFPKGAVEDLMPVQDEINLTRSRIATRIRRLLTKIYITDGAWTQEAADSIQSDEEGQLIKIGGTGAPNQIGELKLGGVSAEVFRHLDEAKQDLSALSGQPEYARATAAEGVDTATEAAILREFAGVRSQDEQATWEAFIECIARKVKALCAEHYDNERAAAISPDVATELEQMMMASGMTAPGMAPPVERSDKMAWVRYDRSFLKGEFDIGVIVGSTLYKNRVLEQRRLNEEFKPLWNHPIIDQYELMKLYLEKSEIHHTKSLLLSREQLAAQAQQTLGREAGANGEMRPHEANAGTEVGQARSTAQEMAALRGITRTTAGVT